MTPFRGNKRDFESEVRPHLAVLYRVAKRMCCRPEEAEDMVGQTLMKAVRAWDGFDGEYVRSWLIRILRNEVLNKRRDDHAHPAVPLSEPVVEAESFWDEVHWRLAAERILEELSDLPDEYRLAVQLCDVEQMTYEEAADAMEVPVGTVRSRLFRGRQILRNRLAGAVVLENG
jgi:RNA polymerase sigma-70 factor, ECF subfamily